MPSAHCSLLFVVWLVLEPSAAADDIHGTLLPGRVPRAVTQRTFSTDCANVSFTYPPTWATPLMSPTCVWLPDGAVLRGSREKRRNALGSTLEGMISIMNGRDPVNFAQSNRVDYVESLPCTISVVVLDDLGIQELNSDLAFDAAGDPVSATVVQMGNNSIRTIANVRFSQTVQRLDFRNNSIAAVGKINSPGCNTMILDRNRIGALDHRDVFPDSLTQLYLGSNRLKSLDAARFPPLLTTLDVGQNQLSSLANVTWPPVLLDLNFTSNAITSLANVSFPPHMRLLELVDNRLSEIHANFPPSLHTLCLARNNITAFYANESQFALLSRLENNSTKLTYMLEVDYAGRYTGLGPCDIFLSTTATNTTCVNHTATRLLWNTFPICIVPDTPEGGDPCVTCTDGPPDDPSPFSALSVVTITSLLLAVVLAGLAVAVCARRRPPRITKGLPSPAPSDDNVTIIAYGGRPPVVLEKAVANDVRGDPTFEGRAIPPRLLRRHRVLASGGYGVVELASLDGRYVATKRLLPTRAQDPVVVAAFMDEIRLLSQLDHPHVVAFVGVSWTSVANVSLVTEFLARGDLWALLHTSPTLAWHVAPTLDVPRSEKSRETRRGMTKDGLLADVVAGLRYLHGCDPTVLHRDLKSKNVLVGDDGRAKLGDLGSSRVMLDDLTMTSEVGTVPWIAPEVLVGKRYDAKADVYSLGVLIAEMDTLEVPYAADPSLTKARVAMLVVAGDLRPAFSSACPASIRTIAAHCLAYDPHERPTAAQVYQWLLHIRAPAPC